MDWQGANGLPETYRCDAATAWIPMGKRGHPRLIGVIRIPPRVVSSDSCSVLPMSSPPAALLEMLPLYAMDTLERAEVAELERALTEHPSLAIELARSAQQRGRSDHVRRKDGHGRHPKRTHRL